MASSSDWLIRPRLKEAKNQSPGSGPLDLNLTEDPEFLPRFDLRYVNSTRFPSSTAPPTKRGKERSPAQMTEGGDGANKHLPFG